MPISNLPAALTAARPLVRLMENGGRFYAHPYPDAKGVWTIGTGHTRWNGAPVTASTPPITPAQDDAALDVDLAACVAAINAHVQRLLDPLQSAALLDLIYNVGPHPVIIPGGVGALINAGRMALAANNFTLWNMAGGHVLPDLVARRALEREIFLGFTDPTDAAALMSAWVRLRANAANGLKSPPVISNPAAASQPTQDEADILMNRYNPGA